MFCSGCGVQIDAALNFCNRCGNRVPKGEAASLAENLSQSMGYVGGFGLLGFIFVTAILIRKDVPMEAFVPIAFFYLGSLVTICWLMLRYSMQLTKMKMESTRSGESYSEPHYLSARTTAQLGDSIQQPASVTEHTTRTLDKIPLDR